MDHYLDIRLLPDPEFLPTVLMNALYGKLHRALMQTGSKRIGVSFPDLDKAFPPLGRRLRLHGSADDIHRLMETRWLTGMTDHVALDPIAPVPPATAHRVVRRVQAKSSPERLQRRRMKRHGIDQAEACRAIPMEAAERLDLPFVTISSRSNGQRFRLFIDHGPPGNQPVSGEFSHYGLSPTATVPWF
jgi:CRISPR-associated endonuclease Csy4